MNKASCRDPMEKLCEQGNGLAEALNVRVFGNGTATLVLAHGFGSDGDMWRLMVPYLACFFKVVVFDLVISPNVSPSLYDPRRYDSNFQAYADDLLCLYRHLGLNNTLYLGHSMSAMIGCLAAIKSPHLFHHLILLGASPRYLNASGYDGGFSRSQVESLFEGMDRDFEGWVKSFAPQAVAVNDTKAIAEFEGSLGRMQKSIALSAAKTVFLSDLRRKLPEVKVAATIVQSKQDPVVTEFVPYYLKRKLGGSKARVKILKTQGHFPMLTAHQLLLKALRNLLGIGIK